MIGMIRGNQPVLRQVVRWGDRPGAWALASSGYGSDWSVGQQPQLLEGLHLGQLGTQISAHRSP